MNLPRAFGLRAVTLSLAGVVLAIEPGMPARAQSSQQNFIQIENAKPGTTDWQLTNPGWTTGVIEGYADVTSVNRGGQINFFVNTSDPTFTIEFFRIGYYQGLGGRRMTNPVTLPGTVQTLPVPDPTTGLIECNWVNPYTLTIPNGADPTDWMSGYYYAKLTSSSGKQWLITFVVRDDARTSDLIMAQAVTTAEAYNLWGGKSLYGTLANRSDTTNASRKTSFHRPYYGDETWGAGQFSGQNDFRFWEWGMVQFLESNGYDVTYATNLDVDRDPNLLLNHKAFLSVGHDEYWSWRMRDNVEHARDVGVSLGFFSANTSYWQVRFENSPTTGAPDSVMVGYKDYCDQDPITPTYLKTCRFRDPRVDRSEDRMIGVMYVTQSRQPFVVEDASHWLFTSTGLKNGDTLINPDGTYFVGYEVDALGPHSPLNLQRAAHSAATARHANFSDMTVYRAASGATVFASGSILWTYSVPQIVQVTKNALARLIDNAFADTTPIRPALPAPFQASDIGDVGRAGFVALAGAASFTLDGAGQDAFNGDDALFYAYQGLQGDGSITARITGVQNYWDNRAGLMIRESLDPTARYVSLVSRPSESRMNGTSGVNEGVEFKSKSIAGGAPAIVAQQDLPMPNWVRLTRTGNVFDAYVSADGATWTHLGSTTMTMSGTALIGVSVASAQHAVWTTASFDNVAVAGGSALTPPAAPSPPPPPAAPPSFPANVNFAAIADLNGDGISDLVIRNTSTGGLAGLAVTNLAIQPMAGFTLGPNGQSLSSVPLSWRVAGSGDLSGDGYADLVWQNTDGSLALWTMRGSTVTGTFSLSIPSVGSSGWQIRAVADVDGDGHADLIWENAIDGGLAVWLMNGPTVVNTLLVTDTSGHPLRMPDPDWVIVGAGDLDRDGKADIVWQNQATGGLGAWTMNANVVLQMHNLTPDFIPTDYRIGGVGDVNGDGIADIIWIRQSTRQLFVWCMNGFDASVYQGPMFTSNGSAASLDANWTLVGPG